MKLDIARKLRRASSYYRKASYIFALVVIAVAVATSPLSSSAQSNQPLNLSFSNVKCSTTSATLGRGASEELAILTGTATLSGNGYSGILYFNGSATISILSNSTLYWSSGSSQQQGSAFTETVYFNNKTELGGGFTPPSINYPQQSSVDFRVQLPYQGGNPGKDTCGADSLTVSAFPPSGHTYEATNTTTLQNAGVIQNDIFYKVVALPLFNDSMLGVTGVNSTDPQLPLSGIYNFLMAVSLIIIVGGGMFSMFVFAKTEEERQPMKVVMSIIFAVVAVLIFPVVYNEIARVVNYLDMGIIAYPNPYQDYATTLQNLWSTLQNQQGGITIWNFFSQAFLQIADWVIALIVWLLLYFLGTIRIFMLAAVIAAFPIAMGLRLIPFAKKLSNMIDDTLFGLILASLMSSIVLGVASYMLSNWSIPGNIFMFAGIGQNWVADAAIIAALLMPTVFAPLTSTVFQTASQIGMAGGGVAAMTAGGAAMAAGPVVPGATMAGMGAARGVLGGIGGAGGGIASQGMGSLGNLYSGTPLTIGQRIARQMELAGGALGSGTRAFTSHMIKHATPGVIQNVGALGTVGVLGAVGAGSASSVMRRAIPIVSPADALARSQAGLGITKVNAVIREAASQPKSAVAVGFQPSAGAYDWASKVADMQPKDAVRRLENAGILPQGSSGNAHINKVGTHFTNQIKSFMDPGKQEVLPQHKQTVSELSKRIRIDTNERTKG